MKSFQRLKLLLFTAILLTSFSCGQYAGNSDYAGGGIGGTGITGVSIGKVTAIDLTNSNIEINGVSFSLNGAGITVNGTTAEITNLKVGMIVKVNGEFDNSGLTGKALTIDFENNLEGPVDAGSIDPIAKTFKILGKTIIVDTGTVFEGTASFDTLIDGNVVEVSGYETADGSIHATYIELKEETFLEGTTQVELKGNISEVDKGANTFKLDNITITYDESNINEGILTDGVNIEVKGTVVINNNFIIVAVKIELHDSKPDVKKGEKVEIEGYITEIISFTETMVDFMVNNQKVHIDLSYSKIKGGDISAIQKGVKIEVKGTIDESGILNATKVSIETEEHEGSDKKLSSVNETNNDVEILTHNNTSADVNTDNTNSPINNSTIDNEDHEDVVQVEAEPNQSDTEDDDKDIEEIDTEDNPEYQEEK